MGSIVLKTPLTAEESQFFNDKFKQLDTDSLNVVTGENLRPLFASSGLSSQILSEIWSLVDFNNKGFLNFNEFAAALRCIGILQQYPSLPVNNSLYENPLHVMPNLLINGTTSATPQGSSIPLPSTSDVNKFAQLFDRSNTAGTNALSGDKAKEIFLKARLPNQTLGEIWGLCDRNASGSLEKPEFIMAMYLIQLSMTGNASLATIPQTLSQDLWNAVNVPQQQQQNVTPGGQLSANSTGTSMTLNRQGTISRLSSGAFNNASMDWVLTPEKKQQFDAIFSSLDKQHLGKLGSQVLVPFFLSSKLNQETLATVWDLADIHNNAEFTNMEFAIAMFLIQKKNAGIDLPDVVPNELLQSPALGLYPNNVQTQPNMTIPSRATKPSFQDMQQQQQPQQPVTNTMVAQNSNNGSLNDLMALNNTFGSSPQPIVRNDTNNSMNSGNHPSAQHSTMNMKKFNPTSQFGQHIIQEEEEANVFNPAPAPAPVAAQPQPPMQRVASVSLPQVPNFGSLNLNSGVAGAAAVGMGIGAAAGAATSGAFHNNDLYADSNASAQLSAATTEMANLSTQMNSLSKQATMTNDKKAKASQELARVTEMKNSLNVKLNTLRTTHEQNVKQTEELQRSLVSINGENDQLKQELSVVEANYHAIETKLNQCNEEFQRAQQENVDFKEKIKNLNIQSATLQTQLEEKQQQVKQQRSMVDVNSKQLDLSQITVANFTNEISGLEEKLTTYLSKRQELDDYEKTIQEKHTQLESRYKELTDKETDLNQRDVQLKDSTQQIEEQEKIYNEQVARLQTMFTDLSQRKDAFDKADQDLKKQHMEYANNVQDLAERQMNLAMGEMPKDSDEIIKQNKMNKQVQTPISPNADDDEVSRTERSGSEVFDKDVPTLASQSEQGEPAAIPDANQPLSDRFEGDLNEYGIPRTESLTSSVANNAPQSVRGDVEVVENLDSRVAGTPLPTTAGTVTEAQNKSVEIPQKDSDTDKDSVAESDNSVQHSLVADEDQTDRDFAKAVDEVEVTGSAPAHAIDEEFPPIRELEIEESDSSDDDDDDQFEDTKDVITPSMQNVSKPVSQPKDEFDDEFAGLEQANVEDEGNDTENEDTNVGYTAAEAMEPFEEPAQADLRDNLEHSNFTGTEPVVDTPAQSHIPQQTNVSNDEWDEIFAGFGNGKQQQQPSQPQSHSKTPVPNALQQPTPDRNSMPASAPRVNRMIATTPKALAIEELSGMGFSEAEATKALEECNWDLDTATNYLLDNA